MDDKELELVDTSIPSERIEVQIELPTVEETKLKAKKQKPVKEDPVVDPFELKYLILKEAAENLIRQYKKNHTVRGPEDLRFPGLRELAEAIK